MPDYTARPDYEIASLKKREAGARDLMMPGNGIPWEDRGAQGTVMAFLRTCGGSLTHHARLLDHIRRPETPHEARLFAIGCSFMWALAVGIWDAVRYVYMNAHPDTYSVDGSQYLMESVIQALLIGALVFVLLVVSVGLYNKLIAGVVRSNRFPPVLTYNVLAYSLGPSLLALIPIVGWIAAAIWIFVNMIIAGSPRLYLRTREAVINAVLVSFVAVLIMIGAWFAWWLVWDKAVSAHESVEMRAAPTVAPRVGPPMMSPMRPPIPRTL